MAAFHNAAAKLSPGIVRCADDSVFHSDETFRKDARKLTLSSAVTPLRLLLPSLALLAVSEAECCTIPVFRFALDRWEADKFHLVLPAEVAQDTAVQDLLRPLRANGKANLDITTAREGGLKSAVLRSSRADGRELWAGELNAASLSALLDSAARQHLLRQILAGDSVIWVIADSGSAADTAAVARIEKRLRFLEQVASLPVQDPHDPDSRLGPGPPLRLKFSTLRLRLDDPAERLLLSMLAGPRKDLDPSHTSFAAAVFGRGRVLGAWPLALLDDAALEDACMFLVGRCGCRLKNESPGWDILLNVDWEKALAAAAEQTTDENADASAPIAPPPSNQATAASRAQVIQTAPRATESNAGVMGRTTMIACLAAALAALIFMPRQPKN